MHCSKCGREIRQGANSCLYCGTPISEGAAQSSDNPYDAYEAGYQPPQGMSIGHRPTMIGRMVRAARLEVSLYEEVEADKTATFQALMVVILVSLAGGIGFVITGDVLALLLGIVAGVVSWAVWALLVFVLGTTIFRTPETKADWGELARTTGFAQSPGVLNILLPIPFIGIIIFFATLIWQLVAMVIAVRQALDYRSTWRAVGVVVVGFIINIAISAVMAYFFFPDQAAQ